MTRPADPFAPLFADLDEDQRRAVTTHAPRVLVLASAGAGKTRVLTYRLVYLLAHFPRAQFLAVTFTNKAADEMRERVAALLDRLGLRVPRDRVWISTFHAFGARVLRQYAHRVGLPNDFLIADEYQQRRVFDTCLRDLGYDPREHRPLYRLFQRFRVDHATPPEDVEPLLREVWPRYLERLRAMKALDFADLQHETLRLFAAVPEVRAHFQERFLAVLVDEFQDTSPPQYRLLQVLRTPGHAFFVVGDQDQSIYGFRGARPEHFQRLLADYPDTEVIPLRYNYRSRERIVQAALQVIAANPDRLPHAVEARQRGGRIVLYGAADEQEEAQWVAEQVAAHLEADPTASLAILVRARSQLPPLERALHQFAVPYRVIGLRGWWDSPAIRAVLDYVAFCQFPDVDAYLLAVCNVPSRKLGPVAVEKLRARAGGRSLWSALAAAVTGADPLPEGWRRFYREARAFMDRRAHLPPRAWVQELIAFLREHWHIPADRRPGYEERWRELVRIVPETASWSDFVDAVGLRTPEEAALIDAEQAAVPVRVMTVHAAKGLEFDVVWLPGVEQGLYPHALSRTESEVREERRVFFVGMTRTRHTVYLSWCRRRWNRLRAPSPFLDEIPPDQVDIRGLPHRDRVAEAPAVAVPDRAAGDRLLPGVHVQHPRFGKGIVQKVTGHGKRMKVTVWFFSGEIRTFRFADSPLQVLG